MPLQPEVLTWTGLLLRWVEFAQASVALPEDARGRAWKESVPHIIMLQAVTFALAEVGGLPAPEQGVAIDKAAYLIDQAVMDLDPLWPTDWPDSIQEMVADARAILKVTRRSTEAENAPNAPPADGYTPPPH